MPQKSMTGKTRWYHKGKSQLQIKSYRDLNEYLSQVSDRLFHAAPKIRNELRKQEAACHHRLRLPGVT